MTRWRRDRLAVEHLHVVRAVVSQLKVRLPKHVERNDLVQEGCLGLLDAASRYDRSRGASFKTWARLRAHGAAVDSIRARDLVGRGGRSGLACRQHEAELVQFGHHLSDGTVLLADELPAASPPERDTIALRWLARALCTLPVHLRRVLTEHYFGGRPLAETGVALGVCESRVSQLKDEALARLRAELPPWCAS